MRYIATREGVERLAGNGAVTKGQRELIQKLLTDFPDAVELFEYEDYCKTPTLGTASAFISNTEKERQTIGSKNQCQCPQDRLSF